MFAICLITNDLFYSNLFLLITIISDVNEKNFYLKIKLKLIDIWFCFFVITIIYIIRT